MTVGLRDLEEELRTSHNEWRWYAASVIQDIRSGYICSYGEVARETNRRAGLNINARNVGWLRGYLYGRTNRDTSIPLHRLAKAGDTRCAADSERTRREAKTLRIQERSWENPKWWSF